MKPMVVADLYFSVYSEVVFMKKRISVKEKKGKKKKKRKRKR